MSKIEAIKAERDGLEIGEDIPRFAREGWESIPDGDRDARLKWWGVFYRKQTPGHFMLRIRVPNGIATADQLRAIGEISRDLGRDTLDLTTRQQIQLRWVRIEDVPGILERLREVGLVTLQTGMDNIRNVIGCPVAGLTPGELFDASSAAREFSEMFVGNSAYTNLPRKLNVMMSGCLDNCVHAETQDIAFVPATKPGAERPVHGFNVLVGGKMGSGGYRVATPLDAFVRVEEAPAVASAIVLLFRDHGQREVRNRARLAFLVEEWGAERVRAEVESRLGRRLPRAGVDARNGGSTDHVGVWRQAADGLSYVGLLVPVGRMRGSRLVELARLAERYGSGEVRLTTEQNVILPGVSDRLLPTLLEEPLLGEFRYDPSPVARGTVSCTGKDFCSLALIETKSYALDLVAQLERGGDGQRALSMNWSGCPAGCGNHQAADIGFVGRQKRVGGEIIDAVDVYVGGSSGPAAVPGVKIVEALPCSDLPAFVRFLTQYGDFRAVRQQVGAFAQAAVDTATDAATDAA